jgi:hypothetical protein
MLLLSTLLFYGQPADVNKEPDTPVVIGHDQLEPSQNLEQPVHDTFEDIYIPEEEGPQRVTRSSEVNRVPEKLTNGTTVAEKGDDYGKPGATEEPGEATTACTQHDGTVDSRSDRK